jgi:hypothetical protein
VGSNTIARGSRYLFFSTDLLRPATVALMRNLQKICALHPRCLLCLLALSGACSETQGDSYDGLNGALAVQPQEQDDADDNGAPGNAAEVDEDLGFEELDCPRGGETAPIAVAFDCDEITVVSCKDLSNVVLELADGTRQRFEGLHGHQATFAGTGANQGAGIVGVWVKAGANHSGDGPGYGQRFDAPAGSCTPGEAGPPPGETPPSNQNPPGDSPPPSDNPPSEDPPPPDQDDDPIVVL